MSFNLLLPYSTKRIILISCIYQYYTELSRGNYDNAWSKLTDKFKNDKFGNSKEKFKKIHETIRGFGGVVVEYDKAKDLISDLFAKEIVYNVSYEGEDNIAKNDLNDEGQQKMNSFWVQIKERQSLSDLKKSTYPVFKIRRVFTQKIRGIKEEGKWRIAQIKTTLIAIRRD